ncbi:MAG: hypothetical protein H0X24_01250 [Ktedonobacterales bacterium]|nr:hypothetical protein [Ktedonobacterales bacterium]
MSESSSPPLPWWRKRARPPWHDLLLVRAQRRDCLHLVTTDPLGATDPIRRVVSVHPAGIPFPVDADLPRVRGAPAGARAFPLVMSCIEIDQEAGDILHRGRKRAGDHNKPGRIERRQVVTSPACAAVFRLVGDVLWPQQADQGGGLRLGEFKVGTLLNRSAEMLAPMAAGELSPEVRASVATMSGIPGVGGRNDFWCSTYAAAAGVQQQLAWMFPIACAVRTTRGVFPPDPNGIPPAHARAPPPYL